jgi:hypothetical protein
MNTVLFSIFRDINFNFNFSGWAVSTVTLVGLFIYFLKNPEKFEKLVALVAKFFNLITKKFDKTYIKYDLQGKINDYLKTVSKKVKHIDIDKINIQWVDIENQTKENFI